MLAPNRSSVTVAVLLQLAAVFWLSAKDPVPVGGKLSLWEVRSGNARIHLLGSVHFLKEDSYPLAKPIEDAVKNAEVVAFETDLEAMSKPEGMMKMLQGGQYPEGKTLAGTLDAPLYARVKKKATAAGLPMELIGGMRPWLVAVTLITMDLQEQGYNPTEGVDHHYHAIAKEAKKRIIGLETVEAQLSFFADLAPADEAAFLSQTLDEMDRLRPLMDQMVTAWRTGDAAGLDKLMNDSLKGQPKLYKRLLVDRNASWIPKIEALVREGRPAVVIVGCAHLVGKDSVVEMLRRKGFTVTQQ
ncbi:MAG: TraB/GumN family protein [Verrucomicrobiales bacterium]|nr:TraB/GumN family protein [Verrucomicrobiales bacterium]